MTSTKAQSHKEKGNASFKAGKYVDAIGHYTAAIIADGKDHTFPLNRAAAYLKLGKNEDAERDCTTVLKLSALNPKALYRRGQARLAIGKLEDAVDDLTQALKREPTNAAIQEELRKATELLEKKKIKTSRPFSSSVPAPQRRRVPIKIIDSSAAPLSDTAHSAPTTSSSETLRPISTRSLKPETSTTRPKSSSSSSAAPTPPPPAPPRTFKDAKQARESIKPSRVGGGIFRADGESKVFPMRSGGGSPLTSSSATPPVSKPPAPVPIVPLVPENPPKTWFDFTRAWDAEPTTTARWGLILSIPPSSIPAIFKISLEPALLMSILAVFREVVSASKDDGGRVRMYMDAFGEVERFGTVVLFLSRAEKEVARGVWEALGMTKEDVAKAWNPVWK
ncbi:hypothetical protein C0995_007869 [Termitomyces sp. Mi166|nr:hypothetical protein C0995_007869 [Termitomyces sp. Mi166\